MPCIVSVASAIIIWKWTEDATIRALLVALIILVGVAGYMASQWLAHRNVAVFKWQTDEGQLGIRRSMISLLYLGQETVIFTRDMSWADYPEIVATLKQKASARELTLCLPREIELSRTLVQAGATAYYYGNMINDPESFDGIPRFTLNRPNTQHSELAFARRRGAVHYIQYSRDSTDPALSLAKDIYRIIRHAVQPTQVSVTK